MRQKYNVCPRCGSYLDYGEICDCARADHKDADPASGAQTAPPKRADGAGHGKERRL